MSKELVQALDALEQERGIDREVVVEALENALKAAYKKQYNANQNVEATFDDKKGKMTIKQVKTVVLDDDLLDPDTEISLTDAQAINKAYEPGDEIRFDVTPKDFGRMAAQAAKQVIVQKMREATRQAVYNRYKDYEGEIITGEVERQDSRFLYVMLPGKQEAVMTPGDQMPTEHYRMRDRIKVLVSKVDDSLKGPQIFVSRTAPGLVKRLFEQEVPEVYDGTVEIVSVAREAGDRSKIAVYTHDADLDPVGALVGQRGARVQAVVTELGGEHMDIVEWVEDEAQYIANALNPAEVTDVIFDPENDQAVTVIVPDDQLSLAIGKKGQNARLAARLTGVKIDIKPESEAADLAVSMDEASDDAFDDAANDAEDTNLDDSVDAMVDDSENPEI
ncbi:transcription termination factor NusA [Fructobacillus fructosus]|uniref:Transcription termination/antitermination protein NusA n=1 Tax=Fructobacillus fructosus TaxID=1631 RepID=A0ABM9MMS6_9LACO|nr:transcription termination factor NusA [Fructobacillus fructosus]MBD9364495.1 transcription termination/antitermination protein NusA [Leuconostoc mesenteroides]KRN53240.1 transcription elongation factor NusA [Fructobacillus fructosus KCTC 3544]MBC9118274.1 transcription termination/antitermination protein NusA [Fructobacillus fructosus]CAK1227382.1 Transcription antitermination factor NusA [Fructobacillus fructosus]CAK1231568.1 Transcription antitermination factor NusA [Fructobacillus fructo